MYNSRHSVHLSQKSGQAKILEATLPFSIVFVSGHNLQFVMHEQCAGYCILCFFLPSCPKGSSPPPPNTQLKMLPPAPVYWYTCPKDKIIND